jgi:glucose/mannose transport system substrate-binding protein
MSRVGDTYYAVPVDVHRDNLIWYNRALLRRHGIDPASLGTWKAVFAAADELRAAGMRHPLQAGSSWTLTMILEGILAGMGADVYEAFINGRMTDAADPRMVEALGTLKTYLSYVPPDHLGVSWSEAVQRVARGEAALCVMGDWANGELELAGLAYGTDYGAVPMPGTRGMYGATVDAFAQPRGTIAPESSTRLMSVAASREALDAFNGVKGSISPRTDADVSGYGRYQREAIAAFKSATVVYPNVAGGTHDAFKAGLDHALAAFQADGDVGKAAAAIAGLAAGSQNKFTRVWKLR